MYVVANVVIYVPGLVHVVRVNNPDYNVIITQHKNSAEYDACVFTRSPACGNLFH